jgi:hypothetical protein
MLILMIKYSYHIAKQSDACLTFELGLLCELGTFSGMRSLPSKVVHMALLMMINMTEAICLSIFTARALRVTIKVSRTPTSMTRQSKRENSI